MRIIGCDFHPSFQQIAMVDTETGEQTERRIAREEAAEFYRGLSGSVRVGMEASGNTLWFERLLAELGHELWLGDAGRVRAMEVRKQKTDRRDAELLLRLMIQERFPRLWIPSQEQRDLRQLLVHRHKLVGMRRQVKNQLQHLALNQGVQQKHKLWTRAGRKLLEELPLEGWTARRREESLQMLDDLEGRIVPLDQAVKQAAEKDRVAGLLQTHPGVGPITALASYLGSAIYRLGSLKIDGVPSLVSNRMWLARGSRGASVHRGPISYGKLRVTLHDFGIKLWCFAFTP